MLSVTTNDSYEPEEEFEDEQEKRVARALDVGELPAAKQACRCLVRAARRALRDTEDVRLMMLYGGISGLRPFLAPEAEELQGELERAAERYGQWIEPAVREALDAFLHVHREPRARPCP